jgi:acyl carrier protein
VDKTDAHRLLERLLAEVAPDIDLNEMDPEAPFQDAVGLDADAFLHLVTALREATGIDVTERDYPLLSTIEGFVDYVIARWDWRLRSDLQSGSTSPTLAREARTETRTLDHRNPHVHCGDPVTELSNLAREMEALEDHLDEVWRQLVGVDIDLAARLALACSLVRSAAHSLDHDTIA